MLIGFITLLEIATRNSVMLLRRIRHPYKVEGVTDPLEGVLRGHQTPIAGVILFGWLSSTVVNMFVVPSLYLRFGELVHAHPASHSHKK